MSTLQLSIIQIKHTQALNKQQLEITNQQQ